MGGLRLVAGPTVEAISLDEAKSQLRVDYSADDELILGQVETARNYVEEVANLALIHQTWDWYLDGFPAGDELEAPRVPLASVTGMYYTAVGAAEATFASSNYLVDAYRQPGRIKLVSGASWPGDELVVVNGVRVRFVAGFGATGGSVPRALRQAMLLLIGHWYEAREETGERERRSIPMGVESLLVNWRDKSLGF